MAAINLPYVQQLLQKNDLNRDNRLDVHEIANASLQQLAQGDQTGGSFFASLLQGGVDRRGLYPDYNGDQAIDAQELARLASASGDPNTIDSGDLQAVFGARYQGGGQGIDTQQLQSLAAKVNPQQQSGPYSGQGGNPQLINQFMQLMLQMMQILLNIFSRR